MEINVQLLFQVIQIVPPLFRGLPPRLGIKKINKIYKHFTKHKEQGTKWKKRFYRYLIFASVIKMNLE